jgi:hypothetical protein
MKPTISALHLDLKTAAGVMIADSEDCEEEEKMREEERIEEDKGRVRKTRCLFCCQQSKSRVHRTTVATLLFWHRFHVVRNRQGLPKSEMVTVCQRKIWNNCGDFGLILFTCSDALLQPARLPSLGMSTIFQRKMWLNCCDIALARCTCSSWLIRVPRPKCLTSAT